MDAFLDKLFYVLKKYRLFIGFYLYCLFSWVWLFEIELGKLATNAFSGKFAQLIVVLVLTLLSAYFYTKSLRLLRLSVKSSRKWLVPIQLVAWWAATELFVSWAVSIVWFGVGAKLDNVLPFTSLSHFAIWTPLGYISRFVGLHGLSGVVFMLIMLSIEPKLRKLLLPSLTVLFVITTVSWWVYRAPSGSKATVLVVSESSEQEKYQEVIRAKDDNLVVFPEYAFTNVESETLVTKVIADSEDSTAYFVGSRFVTENDRVKNQLVAGDTKRGYIYEIDKSRLIPGGEYVPFVTVGLFKILGAQHVLDHFRATREITKAEGEPVEILLQFDDMKVGAGICSSIIAPEDYRNLAKNGANIFTNSAFLGIFNDSKLYEWKHRSMAKSMAVANARAFVQSANSGPSFALDHNGRQLFSTEATVTTEISVDLNNRRTPYSMFGEYMGVVGFIWILLYVWNSRNKR